MFNVLIVDDESITRNGLVNHIQWDKFDIESISTSASGVDGINFIKNNKVDLVISDVRMPGMTGIEMCSEIKKIAPECQIIFLSGYSDKEYLMGAIELEAVSYVEKPINISEVEMAIEKAINKISTSENRKKEIDSVIEESRKIMSQAFLQKLIKGKLSV
ncbi:MAG: response regulator, partial [Lachnospiraceae bacterium]|nr:response regulator [Lachnospiraceae bacterium]